MLHLLVLSFLFLATFALPNPSELHQHFADGVFARAPPSANVTIKNVTFSGNGCVTRADFQFGDFAELFMDSMMVGTFVASSAKRCLVAVDIEVNQGWTYTIKKATDIIGYTSANATFRAEYRVGEQTVSYFSTHL